MKYKPFIIIAYLAGLIPLIGGLSIFFTWWGARTFYSIDLDTLELAGLYSIFISVPIALCGLLLAAFFLGANHPKNLLLSWGALFIILVNLPVIFWMINSIDNIHERTYIKLYNHTGKRIAGIELKGVKLKKEFGGINNNKSSVVWFYPEYTSEYITATETATLKWGSSTDTLSFPMFYPGVCRSLSINKDLKAPRMTLNEQSFCFKCRGISFAFLYPVNP